MAQWPSKGLGPLWMCRWVSSTRSSGVVEGLKLCGWGVIEGGRAPGGMTIEDPGMVRLGRRGGLTSPKRRGA